MKYLEIMQPILDLDGNGILDGNEPILIKNIVTQYLTAYRPAEGDESIMAWELAQKVHHHKVDTLTLENSEYDLLKKATQKPMHPAIIHAQMQLVVKNAKDANTQN